MNEPGHPEDAVETTAVGRDEVARAGRRSFASRRIVRAGSLLAGLAVVAAVLALVVHPLVPPGARTMVQVRDSIQRWQNALYKPLPRAYRSVTTVPPAVVAQVDASADRALARVCTKAFAARQRSARASMGGVVATANVAVIGVDFLRRTWHGDLLVTAKTAGTVVRATYDVWTGALSQPLRLDSERSYSLRLRRQAGLWRVVSARRI